MKHYPLPKKYQFTKNQDSGRFLEQRRDRVHCGVDFYAPRRTPVFAVDDGIIHSISEFTNPNQNVYWNKTFEIILYDELEFFYRYAELETVFVKRNEKVSAGKRIGSVGQVLNSTKINQEDPEYIQRLVKENKTSMLHFEMYNCSPEPSNNYLGGNWFAENKPKGLLDPTRFLTNL
jgi:murein DD-endopeptidase MepM/ murein hydrolase activator NlpD